MQPPGWCVEYGSAAVRSALWIPAVWRWELRGPLQEDYRKTFLHWHIYMDIYIHVLNLYVLYGEIQFKMKCFIVSFFSLSFCVNFREVIMKTLDGCLQVASFSSTRWCRYVVCNTATVLLIATNNCFSSSCQFFFFKFTPINMIVAHCAAWQWNLFLSGSPQSILCKASRVKLYLCQSKKTTHALVLRIFRISLCTHALITSSSSLTWIAVHVCDL